MDLVMPDVDGSDVLQTLRAHESTVKIPIIFHTAKTDPSEIRSMLALGAKGVLGKLPTRRQWRRQLSEFWSPEESAGHRAPDRFVAIHPWVKRSRGRSACCWSASTQSLPVDREFRGIRRRPDGDRCLGGHWAHIRILHTWQLVINTGTTIVTFLMVFLIQRAQNKESRAVHMKLNEIVAALEGASNRLSMSRI